MGAVTGPGHSAAEPKFFATPRSLRTWLRRHHQATAELWVGLHRKGTGMASITWPELVDELLCFGWIDGIRKSLGAESYAIRVTPRRRGSTWSAVNLKRARALLELGRLEPAGRAAFEERDEAKTKQYSFEREHVALGAEYQAMFERRPRAWRYFSAQPPSYRKTATWWVVSAKREDTRRRRLDVLIRASASGQRIDRLRPGNEEARARS